MVDIKISGRKVTVSDALRSHVEEKIGDALKVFDIQPMTCDVVLRVDKNPSNLERKSVEVTVFVRNSVVRVVSSGDDMYGAIDEAAEKVTRQLRRSQKQHSCLLTTYSTHRYRGLGHHTDYPRRGHNDTR